MLSGVRELFRSITKRIPADDDLPSRAHKIECLNRVLDLSLYDVFDHEFDVEKLPNDDYLQMHDRRPSTRVGLAMNRRVVEDSISLLFGEAHFPTPHSDDLVLKNQLASLVKETRLNLVMIEAAQIGSVGSVCLFMRIADGRVLLEPVATTYLTPIWNPRQPDRLLKIVERYKLSGRALTDFGYSGIDPDETYIWCRDWDEESETYYLPQLLDDFRDNKPILVDKAKTMAHRLGFVPALWIKNLPGGDKVDGRCTFEPAIDATIAIDRHLSQLGRALRYQSDPLVHITNPSGTGDLVRSAGNAIVTGEDGDVKLLELTGDAASAVLQYVSHLRRMALEMVRGDRTDPDKLGPAQSGRSIEIMKLPLINLADDLKIIYGEGALLDVLNMVVAVSHRVPLTIGGEDVGAMSEARITLEWPPYFASDAEDRQAEAMRLDTLLKARIISQETATKSVSKSFDIEDVPGELAKIQADRDAMLEAFPDADRQLRVSD